MEENKEKVKVKKNTRKKYNGSKENKQKAATKAKSRTRNTKTKSSKAKTTRPKSELLKEPILEPKKEPVKEPIEESVKEPIEEPIKNDVKVAVGAIESKESARIEELKKQIEKLQAEKQSYYEVSGEGESAIVNAERKDASSINRTKIDIEIYNLQNELRDLLTKETKDDEKIKEDPEKGEENKDDPKNDDKKPEEIDSPEVKAVKDQISSLDNKINSEEWVLRNNEGNYTPEELAQIKAGIDKLKAQRYELNGKLNDLQTGKDIESKESGEKDNEGQEPSKKNDETKDAEPEKDSPEVKALKDKIKELEGKINAENNALINNGGKYLASDIKEIKERLEELKGEHAELLGKLSDLEKNLKEKDSKGKDDDATKAGEPTKDPSKDDSEGKGKDGEKDGKDSKETTEPEMPTYKIGPFKRLLMKIIRKIKSWAKVDGRIARLCDRAEGAVIGNATPLLEGSAEEKEVKKVLEVGKVKDYEKEIADKENAKYSKDKYEKADDHEEAKKKLAQEDMDFLYEKVKEAYELKKAGKEIPLIGEIVNKEYSKVVDEYADQKSTSFDDKKIEEFSKANDIPEVTKDGVMNLTLWMTSKAIVEMAKEKGIVVNQGKGKNANARPLSEIYASLEARVKTDRVSEEYSKDRRTSFGKDEEKSTVKADKPAKSKTEADSKVDKADDDLDK